MANIALLNRCNLRCPYCFADGYTEGEREDITVDTFLSLLDFCAQDGTIGLIGGEPLLHKSIREILEILKNDWRIRQVTLFTNGIFLDKIMDLVSISKLITLVNVNSKRDIGEGNFAKICANLEELLLRVPKERVTLGINVYEVGQDFSDFLSLVKKHGFRRIRISVVIPQDKNEGGISYFIKMKPTLLSLYRDLKELGVSPCYDCNAIPECVYTDEERAFLETLPFENSYEREIFSGKRSVCSPVIDIYPDKTATRCFGMYDRGRVSILDFKNIEDLRNYFFMKQDCTLVHKKSRSECEGCYKFNTFGCFGGCLCYK